MTGVSRWHVLVAVVCLASRPALGQPAGYQPQDKVGQIFIVGNEDTKQDVILNALGLSTGQALRPGDLRTAERNLERLGIFTIDLKTGIRPRVEALEGDGEFKDVLVAVQEAPSRSVKLMPGLTLAGEPVISLVWEDRNFDASRPPLCIHDLTSGRAFRGGGQLFRLELLQVPLLPNRPARPFQLGGSLLPLELFEQWHGTELHANNK